MSLEKLEEELEEEPLKPKAEENYKQPIEKKEFYAKVVTFTNEARKQYGDLIKSVLIFGSAARGDAKKTSDVDVWVILDDTATKSTADVDKIISHLYLLAQELKDIHIQTHTLTEFWQWVKQGSPELMNFLRYGLPVYDTGFIKPVQRMLSMGLLPPSEETIVLKIRTADVRYRKIKADIKSMIFELRYCASDAIQAVVMHYFKAQPDLKAIPEYLEKLVKKKKLEKEFITKFKELDQLWRDIEHKVIKAVTTKHLDKALELAKEIIDKFRKLLPKDIAGEEFPEE